MIKTFRLLAILPILLLSGCLNNATSVRTFYPTSTAKITDEPFVGSIETTKPGNNPGSLSETISIANTPYPSPIFTPEHNTGVIQNCITVKPELPIQYKFTGKLAFETLPPQKENVYTFLDLSSRETTEVPGRKLAFFSVSPNRTMYAYKDWDENQLIVYESDGRIVKTLPWKKDWGSIDGWIDNQHLIIVMAVIDVPGFVKYPRAITILDPFENVEIFLDPDYPNIDTGNTNASWARMGTTAYNPSLTRVVYPGIVENPPSDGYQGFILYGIPEKAKLAEFGNPDWAHQEPSWSPDGSKLLLLVDREFYIVSPDGIPEIITQMNPLEGKRSYTAEFYSWSPDNMKIAFWLLSYETHEISLALLDAKTGMITDTCIRAGFDQNNYITFPYPVWSEDGTSLVIAANYSKDLPGNDVMIVDLAEYTAFTITKNLSPVGWLENP